MNPNSDEFQKLSKESAEAMGELMYALLKEPGQTNKTVLTGMIAAVATASLALRPINMTPLDASAAALSTMTNYFTQMLGEADAIRKNVKAMF